MSDAVEAMIEWCNAQGGINGRQVEGTYYDAQITQVNNVMTEACASEFALVGQGWSLDGSQEQTRRGCGLPSIPGFAVSPQHSNGPLKFEGFPVPADYTVASHAAQVAELFPEQVKKAAVVYANYSATIDSKDKVLSAYPSLGWEFLDCPQEYNITGEADWRPIATNLKNCGAEAVYFSGSPNPNFRNLLEAAALVDYEPIWVTDPNFYDFAFRDWNTSGYGDNVYFRLSAVPFEEAADNPATQQYVDAVEGAGGRTSLLGLQSTSAFLLFATAAKACGADLTRQCLVDELSTITEWTAGGLHAAGNPGENLPSDCGILMKLTGTTFERVVPEETATYDCDPSYAAETSGPVLERSKLDADRISQL
jgi:ABC-type branched-subunit amino acid transport system substrate-binding protein